MLPPSLQLAAPRALALTSSYRLAAVALTPTAHRVAVELFGRHSETSLQLRQHHHFHWWCRRSPARRYASWGRHNPIDGTEQQQHPKRNNETNEDDFELSPREKLWKAKMEIINRMMRTNPYEGLFGPSNRMLRGLNWRDNGWRKIWEEQWRDMEKMSGVMREEAKTMLKAFDKDLKYPDSEVAKQAVENGRVKEELARAGWEYDPISNKMVQKKNEEGVGTSMPGRKEERRNGFVEIPVKPYTERSSEAGESMPGRSEEVRTGFNDIPVKTFRPKVEFCSKQDADLALETGSAKEPMGSSDKPSRRIPVPTTASHAENPVIASTPSKPTLPKDDMDLLTAEDVRARMGHITLPSKETSAQKDAKRSELEAKFLELQELSNKIDAELSSNVAGRSSPKETLTAATNSKDATEKALHEQWRLQREQLKEAAADFQQRERKARRDIRELQQLHQNTSSRISGLQGRSNGLVRSGSLSPKHAVRLDASSAALQADIKVLSKASALLNTAVQASTKMAHAQVPGYVEPSLDRYAWDKKPFAKIRDAEELIQNVRDSLFNAEEVFRAAETKLEKSIKLAGSLNAEVEKQRLAMRGYEEKWRWRQDGSALAASTAPTPKTSGDSELVEEIKDIYEGQYGAINARHRQTPPMQDVTTEEAYAAMSLGGIPEISPASFDGGIYAEPAKASEVPPHPEAFSGTPSLPSDSNPVTAAGEATYTILALDPAMGLITKATTSSTAKSDSEEPIPLAEALQKVAQPAMFISYLPELRRQGFEPISSSENLMVLKRLGGRAANSTVDSFPQSSAGDSTMVSASEAEPIPDLTPTAGLASSTNHQQGLTDADTEFGRIPEGGTSYYSTRLQSPTSSTFQGLKPKKVEPVFSGEQGGHANYERLRRHFRHGLRERKMRRRRARRGFKKFAGTVVTLAAACYMAGVVSEWIRDSKVAEEKTSSIEERP